MSIAQCLKSANYSQNNATEWMCKVHVALAHGPLHGLWCYFKSFSWGYNYDKTTTWRHTERGKVQLAIAQLYT